MIVFKCDVCGIMEEKKSTRFKLSERKDICAECVGYLELAADLISLPQFKEQITDLHNKFFPRGN